MGTQKLPGVDRSVHKGQAQINSPGLHPHTHPDTPLNPTCSRCDDIERLKAALSPIHPPTPPPNSLYSVPLYTGGQRTTELCVTGPEVSPHRKCPQTGSSADMLARICSCSFEQVKNRSATGNTN